jgi:hypothetical protein
MLAPLQPFLFTGVDDNRQSILNEGNAVVGGDKRNDMYVRLRLQTTMLFNINRRFARVEVKVFCFIVYVLRYVKIFYPPPHVE